MRLHWVCWVDRGTERGSPPVHIGSYRHFCKQPTSRDPKYICPVCSSNWQLNSSFLNPSAQGEVGPSWNLLWEMTEEFCWRHEESDQDLPHFLRLILMNAESQRPKGMLGLITLPHLLSTTGRKLLPHSVIPNTALPLWKYPWCWFSSVNRNS